MSSISLSHTKTSVDSSGASEREDRKNFGLSPGRTEEEDSESDSENLDLNLGFLQNLSNNSNKGKLGDNDNGTGYGYAKIKQKGRILSRTNRNVNVAEPIKKASPNQQANDLNDYIMGSLFINNDYHRIFVQRQPINVRPKVDMMSMKPRAYMSTLDFDRYAVGQGGKRYRGSGFFSG